VRNRSEQNVAGVSRRNFITTSAASSVTYALLERSPSAEAAPAALPLGDPVLLTLRVNGGEHRLALDPRTTLLDALRERLELTGSKKGCDQGQCGACTVLVEGRRVLSCLTFAWMVQNRDVTTIEGLAAADGSLHPVQQAFIDHDAFQCGYCTPGQIMSAVACIREGHAASEAEVREYMSGNLCRCGAYPNIVAAVRQAVGVIKEG
jgi:xanthine dehydrogenase YagT iron-sulfur-binding subunit